ncbi:hypothetical protein L6164_031978 [Bauhinia variegata]|uniref:Uncharacterized protein n=1 Tax=Bauhinia variegata TaxID=167791 RepID=A0ACB9KML5_BAUVA|nr:hypothetical protein L6164_031978 [Bauhinia variegata]
MANLPFLQAFGCFLFSSLLFSSCLSTLSYAISDSEAFFISRRQLLHFQEKGEDVPAEIKYDVNITNERLKPAYVALQAWKKAIYSDPSGITDNWVGPDVCSYNGVFCAPALDDPKVQVVAGIDLNNADIAGYLPPELGLLKDLALFHINSNSGAQMARP